MTLYGGMTLYVGSMTCVDSMTLYVSSMSFIFK